jgi:tRNA-dihydrouridine synthase
MKFTPKEQPIIIQLWGKTPENYYKTAKQIVDGTFAKELGLPEGVNFAGIDINMGCPVKVVVRNGNGGAMIDNRDLAVEIIKATREGAAGLLPVSVKTRIGAREVDLSWPELLLDQKLNMLTIHGRTRREMSSVPARWEEIGQIRQMRDDKSLPTLIIGNGDVTSRAQGEELAKKYKLDGIMIGRGVFHDPFVFSGASPWPDYTKEQRIALFRKHVELFAETWKDSGERKIATLNKFCKVYIQNFEGAKELRDKLMNSTSISELLGSLDQVD